MTKDTDSFFGSVDDDAIKRNEELALNVSFDIKEPQINLENIEPMNNTPKLKVDKEDSYKEKYENLLVAFRDLLDCRDNIFLENVDKL